MRDCVILINDRLVSLTHNSLLLIQPPTCPQSRSPTCVRVLVRVIGAVGTVEKVFFVCRLASEHLIVLVHDILTEGIECPHTTKCVLKGEAGTQVQEKGKNLNVIHNIPFLF